MLVNKLIRNPVIYEQVIDNEMVLLNEQTGDLYSLNPTGIRIWQMLEKPENEEEIFDKLTEIHSSLPEETKIELREFLNNLVSKELILPATDEEVASEVEISEAAEFYTVKGEAVSLDYDSPGVVVLSTSDFAQKVTSVGEGGCLQGPS